jgi:hypothetical protein
MLPSCQKRAALMQGHDLCDRLIQGAIANISQYMGRKVESCTPKAQVQAFG